MTDVRTGGAEIIGRASGEWSDLCDEGASSSPFLRPEWFKTFVKNFDKQIELVKVVFAGRLRALLPLEKKWGLLHGVPVRKLQAVFNLNTQRIDLVHGAAESERHEITNAVWDAMRSRSGWDVVELRLVRSDSWLADVVGLAEREGWLTGVWPMDGAPYIALPRSGDTATAIAEFFGSARKHLGKELDRRLRRLRELGSVEFVVTRGCSPELLTRYFDLEARGWKGRRGTAVTDDPRVVRLHEEFATDVAEKNALFVYELKLDDKTIAMCLNIRDSRQMTHWKTSFDEDYARFAPGNLLFRRLLSDCIGQGLAEIDFLSPSTPNKRVWATGEREYVAFYIFRRGLIGSLLWGWKFGIVAGLRSWKTRTAFGLKTAHAHK